jgi:hypothetical protein
MNKIDVAAFDDMITTQDLTGAYPSDKQNNKNHEASKERNAPKNYGKNQKTSTVMTDKKKCKK